MEFVKLEKGKLIDAQEGFVDSWNRMVDCWNNLSGEGNAKVEWPTERNPTVNVYGGDGDGDDDEDEDADDDSREDEIPDIVLPPFDHRRPNSGGGAAVAGMFEPTFANGVISSFGNGFWPYGRSLRTTVTVDSSAYVSNGLIGLEITHKTIGASPSAVIKLIDNAISDIANTSTSKTVLPLFLVTNGKIAIDCRASLALAIRE